MSDEKCKMMFAPWPARQRGTGKVRAQQNQPDVEPGRAVHVGACHIRVEGRLVNRARDGGNNNYTEQNDREF